jgi:transcriptional regulator with XRE-family HTH domain
MYHINASYRNKENLKELYWKKGLSLSEIAKLYNVTPQAIWYWMNKFRIPSRQRPKNMKIKYDISKELLEELYLKKKLSTEKIAKLLGIRSHSSVLMKLMKYGIPRRTLSEIRTKYQKIPFSGALIEKAYIIGLRAGDLSAEKNHNMIRVATASTHLAQIEMFNEIFGKYTHVHAYLTNNESGSEIRVYCDLDKSFDFILKKPETIPRWILKDNKLFFAFLAGYMDAEGSWNILKNGKNSVRFTFRIATEDRNILEQIKRKLKRLGFNAFLYLDTPKGSIKGKYKCEYTKDLYALWITSKTGILKLIKELLPLSHHSEKIRKMKLILEAEDKKWSEIGNKVLGLRRKIKSEKINHNSSLNS